MRRLAWIALALLFVLAAPASAQRPESALHAEIALPGAEGRFLNVDVRRGGEGLLLVGCVSEARGVCDEVSRVALTERQALELTSYVAAMEARMRCPPPQGADGDRPFTITTHGARGGTFEGALPADEARIAERTAGPCAASARLAAYLVARFGAR